MKLKQNALTKALEIEDLKVEALERGKIYRFWFNIVTDTFGQPMQVPVIVARGQKKGPVLGLTAAVHGNELNGIPVIQQIFKEINVAQLSGTVVGIPAVNIPSLIRKQRRFNDGNDLNHIMPGVRNGNISQVYAYRFFNRIVRNFNYLIDLHTASFGRINSYYIRADMKEPITAQLARLQNPEIIVHNPPSDGTLRGAADEIGIPAITLEVGDPNAYQRDMIRSALEGIRNVLVFLNMVEGSIKEADEPTVLCKKSYWIYTEMGGLLRVLHKVTDRVKAGELIAIQQNIFGDIVKEYVAPEDGIVIGKSVSPINQTGGRILHLGIVKEGL